MVHIPTDETPDKPKDQSLFNAGIAKLERINSLWRRAHDARYEGRNKDWLFTLDELKGEFWAEGLSLQQKQELNQLSQNAIESMAVDARQGSRNGIPLNAYISLDKYQIELHIIEKATGLGMPSMPKGASAMDL